jgi:DUF1365 family protein
VNQPLLGTGQVRHLRLRPARHGFDYPTWFLLLPLRSLRQQPCAALPRNRWGWASFFDADHGDGRADCLAWIDEFLQREGVADAQGEVWLHTTPRMLGYAFKPVNFWYCERRDGTLAAIVAEVNNTFGGRHCYVLQGETLGYGRELRAGKAFHVSPFNRIEGGYRFRFMRTTVCTTGSTGPSDAGRCVARIDYDDAQGPLLRTSVSGRLAPLTAASLRAAVWRMPLLTLGVIVRIHWQALRLAAKHVPFFGRQGGVPAPGGTSVHPL